MIEWARLLKLQGRDESIDRDLVRQFKSLQGFVGVATAQLEGLADLYFVDSTLLLHPTLTLIRGIAEASGRAIWMFEQWIAPLGEDAQLTEEEWLRLSEPLFARCQLIFLDELNNRSHRYSVQGQQEFLDANKLETRKERSRIVALHGADNVRVTGRSKDWKIDGERLPTMTEQVTIATEYAYGQCARHSGMNPYPMLSGYAHGSLDVVFGYQTPGETLGLRILLAAPDYEVGLIASLALRVYSVLLDVSMKVLGVAPEAFASWTKDVETFVVSVSAGAPKAGSTEDS